MKKTHLSVRDEPAFAGGRFEADPAEARVPGRPGERDEIDALRDSVANEPWAAGPVAAPAFGEWLVRRRQATGLPGNLACTLAAALAGGPFAVAGAFMAGRQGAALAVYLVLVGPVTEELLKQSGMIYLLERKPYRVFAAWQFLFAAAVSAFLFAAIENLVYIHVYAAATPMADRAAFAAFRWGACTALHVACSVIASLGLVRTWRRMTVRGEPADLSAAFPLFAVAIALHGLYNLGALLLDPRF